MFRYNKIVSDEFKVPAMVDCDSFILRPLSPDYSDLDYDAVIASKTILGNIFFRHLA